MLLQLENIETGLSEDAFRAAKQALTNKARRLLNKERRWNLAGALLLVAAFLILFMNSIHCAMLPAGTCA